MLECYPQVLLDSPDMAHPVFNLQDVPGKGKGLVATRRITKAECILAETPLFTLEQSAPAVANMKIIAALSALSDAQQRQFFSLTNARRGIPGIPPPLGIFKTNALPCGDHMHGGGGPVADKAALCLVGSRFNSSCEPNVNNYWNADRRQILFQAVRDVEEGEELCICYTNTLASRAQRRERLEQVFGFVCNCVACAREGDALAKSDERRMATSRLYSEIASCGAKPSLGVRKVKMALKLLAEENLADSRSASFYYDAFQFCISVSDVRNAKEWVTKAWAAYCVERGPECPDAEKMATYKENPRAHPAFGLLPKQFLVGPE
ncbi:SET domain-containing protein [Daedaleopsis nitida]|nr:SET domain-containing protein [Daedaleopsis nitida]